MENIIKGIRQYYPVSDSSLEDLFSHMENAIRIEDLNRIYETNIEIANWGRVIHQECLLYMDMHHINRLYLPAKERYEQLLREQPDVIHRAQLGYIASFLGMTPQHLSRLRSES